MRPDRLDRELFIPAETIVEAISRIFSLTGAPHRSRGEKRALVALRDALGLDVDVVRTNPVMGRRLAEALNVEWLAEFHESSNKVTLAGLNALLEGAADAFRNGSLTRLRADAPAGIDGPEWSAFQPAVSKVEAVTRIARLTDAPEEWLGPGSKEHKSVLVNLADRLVPDIRLDRSSKTRMARDLSHELGVPWTDLCYSTGETISLEGLNVILAGAERRLGRLGTTVAQLLLDPAEEGRALASALQDGWKAEWWDGREKVSWLAKSGARGANDNEWQGWYFEARGREILNAAFPPSADEVRTSFGNTTFDYSMNRVWDLKAHTDEKLEDGRLVSSASKALLLNDEVAMRDCVAAQGLGFLVLGGRAAMDDDGAFVAWHRDFKSRQGKKVAASNSGTSRTRKRAFAPLRVDAFWVADTPALDAALSSGALAVRPIGRQPPRVPGEPGAPRGDKFELRPAAALTDLLVGHREWTYLPGALNSDR